MSTIITNLRGSKVTPIHRGSVLLFKQEDLCSTSYCFGITLRGKNSLLYELLRLCLFVSALSKCANVEPAVNRQPGFRRELVEQITSFIMNALNFLHGELLKYKFRNPGFFIPNLHENSKISYFFNILVRRYPSC